MNPLFFVRYEPKLMLVDCMGMSVPAELAHRRLCDWCWAQGTFPPSKQQLLTEITRVRPAAWHLVLPALQAKGWTIRNGRMHHPGVQRVLEEGKAVHAAAVARGKAGARRRWRDGSTIDTPSLPSMNPPKQSQSQSQSHSQGANSAERLTRSVAAHKQRNEKENQFMKELKHTLARFDAKTVSREIEGWGGWWRNRFRENADKARRVLADIHSQVKEHNISKTPGAAAVDLWNRLP